MEKVNFLELREAFATFQYMQYFMKASSSQWINDG